MQHRYGEHNYIPIEQYKSASGVGEYITNSLLENFHTADEVEQFQHWMAGQTCMAVNGETAIYSYDYERWLKGLPCND